jgi:hypothetical protein
MEIKFFGGPFLFIVVVFLRQDRTEWLQLLLIPSGCEFNVTSILHSCTDVSHSFLTDDSDLKTRMCPMFMRNLRTGNNNYKEDRRGRLAGIESLIGPRSIVLWRVCGVCGCCASPVNPVNSAQSRKKGFGHPFIRSLI